MAAANKLAKFDFMVQPFNTRARSPVSAYQSRAPHLVSQITIQARGPRNPKNPRFILSIGIFRRAGGSPFSGSMLHATLRQVRKPKEQTHE
jgi:hypothetical protein